MDLRTLNKCIDIDLTHLSHQTLSLAFPHVISDNLFCHFLPKGLIFFIFSGTGSLNLVEEIDLVTNDFDTLPTSPYDNSYMILKCALIFYAYS